MSQYRTGTVSVTNGSPIVSGSGTAWIENVSIGDAFKIESENVVYSVASVDSDNQITLSTNYVGVTASGLTYQIVVDFTPNLELPEIWAGDIDWPYHLTQGLRRIDTLFAGLVNTTKETCRVATTANLDCTYSDTALTLTANANGAISIDGISLAANNRVLVKDQTSGTQNGIYYVSTVGTAVTPYVLTRATDFDSSSDIKAGVTTVVTEGTVNKDTGWMLTTNDTITLDTTSLTFEIFARAGTSAAGMTTATDPAENAACTTAIVDEYSGTIITTTTTGNSQTIQSPTDTRAGKIFTVVNNDTSTHSIPIVANSVTFTITAGEAQSFIWDGAQWGPTDMGITAIPVTVSQGGTGLATLTDHGILLGSGTGAVTPMSVGTDGQLVKGVSASDPIWSTTTLTDGTNTFNLTNGTASLDVAAGKTVNIDDDVTVSAELHVEAATHVNQDLTTDSVTVAFGALTVPSIIAPAASLIIKPTTDATTAIQVADKDGNAILNVDTTNDRVGIGTTGPGYKFDVRQDLGGTYGAYIKNNDWNGGGLLINAGSSGSIAALQVSNNNGDVGFLTVETSGNVGIGTTGPGKKLTVSDSAAGGGVIRIEKNTARSTGNGTEVGTLNFYNYDADGPKIIAFVDGSSNTEGAYQGLKLFASNNEVYDGITILANGNVGIGTTAPDKSLEINSATGACLRLTYNDANGSASNYTDFSVSSGGDLTIAPSGGDGIITGNFLPTTDSTYNLGSSSYKWANIYTADLHLSNDRGDWTVIEEESYLTVKNNKTGKIYRLVMEEVQ